MDKKQPSVVISEPHIYGTRARYGGHQYAHIFRNYGWKVLLFSSSFFVLRTILPHNSNLKKHISLWHKGCTEIGHKFKNYCFAHLLPSAIRTKYPFNLISHDLYIPKISKLLEYEGISKVDLLWLHGNEDWLFRQAVPHDKLIVRIIDNYEGYHPKYNNYHPLMVKTIKEADGVFTCTQNVRNVYQEIREDIKVIPNGVDYYHFSGDIKKEPDNLISIPRPRILYVGVIREWFDLDLLFKLARSFPNCSFVIVGPWQINKPALIKGQTNLYILGEIPYKLLPGILSYCDVGIVPFKINNKLVQGVSPIKIYEYLAAGLPVVSTYWKELEMQAMPIFLAKNTEEFIKGVKASLKYSFQDKEELRQYAKTCSWEQRLKFMLKHVGIQLESD
ncbi:MAG: glycosyltransferase [Candidatus Helarchaeota archaeon]